MHGSGDAQVVLSDGELYALIVVHAKIESITWYQKKSFFFREDDQANTETKKMLIGINRINLNKI